MATRKSQLYTLTPTPLPNTYTDGCLATGSRGPGIDINVPIEYVGNIRLSLGAVQEIAEVAGFSVNAEGAKLEEDNAYLEAANQALTKRVAELEEQLSTVGAVILQAQARSVSGSS